MSKVTLESLRADLEAATLEQIAALADYVIIDTQSYSRSERVAATQRAKAAVAAHDRNGKIYMIVRDEGLEAAMLWKLAQP